MDKIIEIKQFHYRIWYARADYTNGLWIPVPFFRTASPDQIREALMPFNPEYVIAVPEFEP